MFANHCHKKRIIHIMSLHVQACMCAFNRLSAAVVTLLAMLRLDNKSTPQKTSCKTWMHRNKDVHDVANDVENLLKVVQRLHDLD